MTEQLAFQKIQRNGRAIQLDKSSPATLTGVVNGMCDEFFSCAGFPLDEDGRVCGRNSLYLVENRFQSGATADDALGLIRHRVRDYCIISHTHLYT